MAGPNPIGTKLPPTGWGVSDWNATPWGPPSPNFSASVYFPPTLEINTQDERYGVVLLTETQGNTLLRELSLQSSYEEIWGYLPSSFTWVELGIKALPIHVQKQTDGSSSVDIRISYDETRLLSLMQNDPSIVLYHIHPIQSVHQLIQADAAKNTTTTWDALALPSGPDLVQVVHYTRIFAQKFPNRPLRFRVVSMWGVTEFSLTAKGMSEFFGQDEQSLLFPFQAVMELSVQPEEKNSKTSPVERIQNACKKINALGEFSLTFTPL